MTTKRLEKREMAGIADRRPGGIELDGQIVAQNRGDPGHQLNAEAAQNPMLESADHRRRDADHSTQLALRQACRTTQASKFETDHPTDAIRDPGSFGDGAVTWWHRSIIGTGHYRLVIAGLLEPPGWTGWAEWRRPARRLGRVAPVGQTGLVGQTCTG